jgi:tRNA threonylcarbamoyladenosine biosynthesis protein TsaB
MKVLVLDTAMGACAVGVFEDGRCLAARSEIMARGHQERLGGLAQAVMAEAEVENPGPGQTVGRGIDRIGVTVGPGSFTGLRVGLAFAQGLGLALDRPVMGLNTLDGLAASLETGGATTGLVAAVADARRAQVYVRLYRSGEPLGAPAALSADQAVSAIAAARALGDPLTVVGSGAPLLADRVPDAALRVLDAPTLEALAELTMRAADQDIAAPLYLRGPDAKLPTPRP